MTPEKTTTSLRLDPEDFPKRIELELSDEAAEKIREISQRTGRSFSEVATDILSKALEQ
ncbi:MAG: ribbon-helix-helix protein, CopG family [Cyanobium sp. M30B3]|jgi:predicted DNA-binding protein|nr:MAG: ribbon-helix-helix protein, CopG family [Cyanobium sp. M30B3]